MKIQAWKPETSYALSRSSTLAHKQRTTTWRWHQVPTITTGLIASGRRRTSRSSTSRPWSTFLPSYHSLISHYRPTAALLDSSRATMELFILTNTAQLNWDMYVYDLKFASSIYRENFVLWDWHKRVNQTACVLKLYKSMYCYYI